MPGSTMEKLNADCLAHIFLNLDFIERVKLETVCWMWYYVLQDPSTFSDMTDLNIAKYLSSTTSGYYQQESISFIPTVIGIVERCGSYVRKISFDSRWLKISQPIADCLASYCKQLRVLDLGGTIIAADISQLLLSVAENLEEFSLEDTSWVNPENADKVPLYFGAFKRLRRANFRTAMFKMNRIYELPSSLRFIQMSASKRFPAEDLSDFLLTHNQLEEIYLSPTPAIDQSVVFHLSQLQKLHHLSIGFIDHSSEEIPMECLAELTNLRSLHLQNCTCINELSLRIILAALTELEELRIEKCKSIFDYSALVLCRNVTRLHIGDTVHFINEDLCAIANYRQLISLSISKCPGIGTPAVQHTLWRCQLEELLLVSCVNVTDEAMLTLAHTQYDIRSISVQGCTGVTSKGVAALGYLHNVCKLRDIDISRNRYMDDMALLNLHNALSLMDQNNNEEDEEIEPEEDKLKKRGDPKRLTVYVFQTSVHSSIENRVGNLLDVIF